VSSFDTTLEPAVSRDQSRALFGQTMGLVAVTTGFFALGAYLGRDLSRGWGIVLFIASFALLFGLNYAAQRSEQLAIGCLFGHRARDRADDRLLRGDEPSVGVAGGRGDRALHRRVRGSRICDTP
jgi:hypothetical protein